jgi:predicted transcriptional regulator
MLKAAAETNFLAQEKRKRGRPPCEPTQKDRDFVIAMVEHGATHDEIAAVIGVSDETLRRHCRFELQRGLIKAQTQVPKRHQHADVARTLLMRAVGGPGRDWTKANDTALIFYAKTRMKYVEPAREIEIPDLRVEDLSDRQLDILLERIVARRRSLIEG